MQHWTPGGLWEASQCSADRSRAADCRHQSPVSGSVGCQWQRNWRSLATQQDDDSEWHPVAYSSRRVQPEESRYTIMEWETLPAIHALRVWKLYLFRPFEPITDNLGVTYLQTKKNLTKQEARWVELLALGDFDVTLVHRPGKENIADPLWRVGEESSVDLHDPETWKVTESASLEMERSKKMRTSEETDGSVLLSLMKTLDWRVMLTTTLRTSEQQRYLFLLTQDARSRSLQDIVETRSWDTSFNESRGIWSFTTRIFGMLRRRCCISFRMESVDFASQLVRLDRSCWSCVMTFHPLATQAEIEPTLGWRDHIIDLACPSMSRDLFGLVRSANTTRVTGLDRRRFSAFQFRRSLGKTFLWILSQVYQFLLQGATLCWLLLIVWRSRHTLCQRRRRLMLLTLQSCTFKMYFVCMG